MSYAQRAFEMVQGYLPYHVAELDEPTPVDNMLCLVGPISEAEKDSLSRLYTLSDDDFDLRLDAVIEAEHQQAEDRIITTMHQPKEETVMELKDGFADSIDSIVTLAKAWATDSLVSGKPVCGHTELKRQLLAAIETNDERALKALITAGFDWGYDVQTGVASLAYRGGQSLAFTKDSIEDGDETVAPSTIVATLDTQFDGLATYNVSSNLRFYVQHSDSLNGLRIPYRDEGRGGWLVAVVSDITGAYLYHELAFAKGYLKKLDQVTLPVETFDQLVTMGIIVAYNPQEEDASE